MTQEYVALIILTLTFESIILILANIGNLEVLRDPWILVMLGFASYRGGRSLAYNHVFEWLRKPFTRIVNDSSGAGQSVESDGTGWRKAIGELLCCPVCSGTWVALVLTSLLVTFYNWGLAMTFILAAAGIGEVIHWFTTRDEWQGRQAREEAGTAWLLKNRGTIYPDRQDSTESSVEEDVSVLFRKKVK
jgi:hypothetical protein